MAALHPPRIKSAPAGSLHHTRRLGHWTWLQAMVGIDDAAAGDAAGVRQPELTPISFASATNSRRRRRCGEAASAWEDAVPPKSDSVEGIVLNFVNENLIASGVREEQLQEHQEGLLMYLEEHRDNVYEITVGILSAGSDLAESRKSPTKNDDDSTTSSEGFCSRHKGAEHIKPLPEELAISEGPVLGEMLLFWKAKICLIEAPPFLYKYLLQEC